MMSPRSFPLKSKSSTPDRMLASLGGLPELSSAPLTTHAALNQPQQLRAVLAEGADPNLRDPDRDRVPLHWACARGNAKCALALIEAGADATERELSSGLTCSELAASRGHHD